MPCRSGPRNTARARDTDRLEAVVGDRARVVSGDGDGDGDGGVVAAVAVLVVVPLLAGLAGMGCAKVQSGPLDDPGPGGPVSQRDASSPSDFAVRGEGGSVFPVDAWGSEFAGNCGQQLRAVVRDFRGSAGPNGEPKHPDFEFQIGDVKGLVAPLIGPDDKPVYAPAGPTAVTNGPDAFAQWYRDVPDVNIRFEIEIPLSPDPARPGFFVYDSDAYFPIDNMGFTNQYQSHNYDFTTEVHFNFPYQGGEIFTFRGDDDLWLFVNGHLAIDLGGVHIAEKGTVDLDQQAAALGITPNHVYRMDIFQAERHLSDSTFHIETTLQCIDNVVIP